MRQGGNLRPDIPAPTIITLFAHAHKEVEPASASSSLSLRNPTDWSYYYNVLAAVAAFLPPPHRLYEDARPHLNAYEKVTVLAGKVVLDGEVGGQVGTSRRGRGRTGIAVVLALNSRQDFQRTAAS